MTGFDTSGMLKLFAENRKLGVAVAEKASEQCLSRTLKSVPLKDYWGYAVFMMAKMNPSTPVIKVSRLVNGQVLSEKAMHGGDGGG